MATDLKLSSQCTILQRRNIVQGFVSLAAENVGQKAVLLCKPALSNKAKVFVGTQKYWSGVEKTRKSLV